MRVVELLVLEGALPSAVAITVDVLATANRLRVAAGRAPAFALRTSGSGRRMADVLLHDGVRARGPARSSRPALVVVPGLQAVTPAAVAARLALPDARRACAALTVAIAGGAHVAASCSAVFLLAEAGLLDGRRATTTWWLAPALRERHPRVELDADAMVVRDGPVITAGAAMAHLDLMLAVVARYGTRPLASEVARYLLLDERRSQARYMALGFLASADPDVARAERWARTRLADGIRVDDLARVAGMSARTFARRVSRATGMSPVAFLQRLRVEQATELLETTRLAVEEIARRVGYAEPTTLRRLLRRETGGRPSELRASATAVR